MHATHIKKEHRRHGETNCCQESTKDKKTCKYRNNVVNDAKRETIERKTSFGEVNTKGEVGVKIKLDTQHMRFFDWIPFFQII